MELRRYAQIIYRRLWVPLLLVAVVLGGSFIIRKPPQPSYRAELRFIYGLAPEAPSGPYYTYDSYYAWLSSEYLGDDFSEVVRSGAFAQDVNKRLASRGLAIPAGAIQAATRSQKRHRIISLSVTWGDPVQAQAIAEATASALQEEGAKYFAQLGAKEAQAYLIDGPSVGRVAPSLKERLDLPLRAVLALVAGIGLAFLWEYLDDTVRTVEDLEALGLPILGALPSPGSWWSRPFSRR